MPARRRGDLALFIVYCLFYGGFMALAAFGQTLMARPVFGAINLAVAYGMALIIGAILLALVAAMTHQRDGADQ